MSQYYFKYVKKINNVEREGGVILDCQFRLKFSQEGAIEESRRMKRNKKLKIFVYVIECWVCCYCCCCCIAQSCPPLCGPVDCSTPVFPVLYRCIKEYLMLAHRLTRR